LGDDEAYNVYDQPWNSSTAVASQIYKPTKTNKDNYDDAEALVNASKRFVLFLLMIERILSCLFLFVLDLNKNVASKEQIVQHLEMVRCNFNVKKIHSV
jgi:hypothetical protein